MRYMYKMNFGVSRKSAFYINSAYMNDPMLTQPAVLAQTIQELTCPAPPLSLQGFTKFPYCGCYRVAENEG